MRAPPNGSSRSTRCSPPSTSTVPSTRARRSPISPRARRWRRSSATGRPGAGRTRPRTRRRTRGPLRAADRAARLLLELGRAGDASRPAGPRCSGGRAGRARRALIEMAAGMRINDRLAEGLAALEEAEPLAEQAGLAPTLASAPSARQPAVSARPPPRNACAHTSARWPARTRAGSPEAEAVALGGLGDAYYLQARMRSAHAQFVRLCGRAGAASADWVGPSRSRSCRWSDGPGCI